MMRDGDGTEPVMIKKYANRRLYNTAASGYVTLDHLSRMVRDGTHFVVQDAKTGEDITRSVLTQIIVEEEAKGQNLLPISFMRQLISFYGDSLSGLVPCYLEYSMQAFSQHEEKMRALLQNALEGLFPFHQFEEMGRQNIAFFESAMKIFTPFFLSVERKETASKNDSPSLQNFLSDKNGIEALLSKIESIQRQLNHLMELSHHHE